MPSIKITFPEEFTFKKRSRIFSNISGMGIIKNGIRYVGNSLEIFYIGKYSENVKNYLRSLEDGGTIKIEYLD